MDIRYLVDILLAFLLGGVAGTWLERRWTQADEPSETDERSLGALRLEWKDTQDRLEHLYDRLRKRARLPETEDALQARGDASIPAGLTKEQLRQVARQRGLM